LLQDCKAFTNCLLIINDVDSCEIWCFFLRRVQTYYDIAMKQVTTTEDYPGLSETRDFIEEESYANVFMPPAYPISPPFLSCAKKRLSKSNLWDGNPYLKLHKTRKGN